MNFIIQLSRSLVGSLFIVSGLIKANDTVGFSYKLEEYFSPDVLGFLNFLEPYVLPIAMIICILEIVLGVSILFGTKVKLTSWLLLLTIVFFTFLTFYSAYFNKVTDCGCFGDALKLTPWQSFGKDVGLLFFVVVIFLNRNKIELNTSKDDWMYLISSVILISIFSLIILNNPWSFPILFTAAVLGLIVLTKTMIKTNAIPDIIWGIAAVASTVFTMYCYRNLPIKDFRPYALGKSIPEQMKIPEGVEGDQYETILTYENTETEEVKDFTMSNYPWDDPAWQWKSTESKLVKKGYEPPVHDFNIIGTDGNDYTEDLLSEPYLFLLISENIEHANEEVQPTINQLVTKINADGHYFFGISASLYEDVEEFRHRNQSQFDYYSADQTTLRTIVRSNPGLVLLNNGVILGKWHYNNLPDIEEIRALVK